MKRFYISLFLTICFLTICTAQDNKKDSLSRTSREKADKGNSQNYFDIIYIEKAQRFISMSELELPSDYIVMIFARNYFICCPYEDKYLLYRYIDKYDDKLEEWSYSLESVIKKKKNVKSVFYKIFNSDCTSTQSFLPDSIFKTILYSDFSGHYFLYFLYIKNEDKFCEFNIPLFCDEVKAMDYFPLNKDIYSDLTGMLLEQCFNPIRKRKK